MRFREWPPRRIALMWLIGAALQVLVLAVLPSLMGWEWADPNDLAWDTDSSPWLLSADSIQQASASAAPVADSATSPRLAMTRTEVAPGDTLVRMEMDSSWAQYRTTERVVQLSPDLEKAAVPIGETLADMLVALSWAITLALLMVFTIPGVLVITTLAWLVMRRMPDRAAVDRTS
ncbi:hypothetical protein [Longimicrobium sp.]|uniref:hypothetical protein n=1 Tax=Longimicrobium sp. TaxID=2029185 RepID=UPI002E2FB1BE|nr:hypothetical protein [Longimicrobium sp.]HEX6040079.1 hypothetical protein [Longimicrobium sp.]